MGKRNKVRYKSMPRARVTITLSGAIFLQYRDDDAIAAAQKGDLMVYAENKALHTTHQGEYESTGFSGYFKVDVSDGKEWRAVILDGLFPQHENHFSKSECPIDTYALCEEALRALAGRSLLRTYREHYELEEAATP